MAVEETLLGLLRRNARHGYDLAREFAPGTALGGIVRLEMGMLYTHLKKLEREGFVRAEIETQGARPPRKVFEITDDGRRMLARWLARPVEHTRDLRLEFLLKLYIARDDEPEVAQRLMTQQQEVCERFVTSLTEQVIAERDDFRRLVLEMRLAQNRALLDWLRRAGAQVRA